MTSKQCPGCGGVSTQSYRCEHCGKDLVNAGEGGESA